MKPQNLNAILSIDETRHELRFLIRGIATPSVGTSFVVPVDAGSRIDCVRERWKPAASVRCLGQRGRRRRVGNDGAFEARDVDSHDADLGVLLRVTVMADVPFAAAELADFELGPLLAEASTTSATMDAPSIKGRPI